MILLLLLLLLFQDEVALVPAGGMVDGSTLFIRVLSFLDEMAKDQVQVIQCWAFTGTEVFRVLQTVIFKRVKHGLKFSVRGDIQSEITNSKPNFSNVLKL